MKKILVVEELEPYLETEVKAIAQEVGATAPINGKGEEWIPRHFELSGDRIRPAVARLPWCFLCSSCDKSDQKLYSKPTKPPCSNRLPLRSISAISGVSMT